MKPRLAALFAALLTSLLLVQASPASASSGTFSSLNGVLYSGCREHTYHYSVALPWDASDWDLTVTLLGPDGVEVDSDYLYSGSDPSSGTSTFQICNDEMAGRYTIKGELASYDTDYNETDSTLTPAAFLMRKPRTRTTLSTARHNVRYGSVVAFHVTSKDERPAGYFANTYANIHLERYVAGAWRLIPGTRTTTDDFGRATLKGRFSWHHAMRYRAVTERTSDYSRSYSAIWWLY